jgi:hypothetical protein
MVKSQVEYSIVRIVIALFFLSLWVVKLVLINKWYNFGKHYFAIMNSWLVNRPAVMRPCGRQRMFDVLLYRKAGVWWRR